MRTFVLATMMLASSSVFGDRTAYYFGNHYDREPRIVVETRDCSGSDGLATFQAERLFTIQRGDCQDPANQDQYLYQVLLRSLNGASSYDVIWVDDLGRETIRRQLEENRRRKLSQSERY